MSHTDFGSQLLSSSVGFHKQFNRDAGLLDRALQRAYGEFLMHWNYTASLSPAENDVAAFLASNNETEHFERLNGILARDARQFRH